MGLAMEWGEVMAYLPHDSEISKTKVINSIAWVLWDTDMVQACRLTTTRRRVRALFGTMNSLILIRSNTFNTHVNDPRREFVGF